MHLVIFVVNKDLLYLFKLPCARSFWDDPLYSGEVKFNFIVDLYDLPNSIFDDIPLMIQNIDLTWFLASVIPAFHSGIVVWVSWIEMSGEMGGGEHVDPELLPVWVIKLVFALHAAALKEEIQSCWLHIDVFQNRVVWTIISSSH